MATKPLPNPALYAPSIFDYYAGIALAAELAQHPAPGRNSIFRTEYLQDVSERACRTALVMLEVRRDFIPPLEPKP